MTEAPITETGAIQRYIDWMESLTPTRVEDLRTLADPGLVFGDPFHTVTGLEAVLAMYRRMFQQVGAVRFQVLDRVRSANGTWYLKWQFDAVRRSGGTALSFPGLSEITLSADGRVLTHIDTWDSGHHFYARLPILGWVIERIRRRVAGV